MGGLGKQGKTKAARRRAKAMFRPETEDGGPVWTRPDPEEWEHSPTYSFAPEGADGSEHRILVRMINHFETGSMIEFALMQQTHANGKWHDVAGVDSCHDTDVHLHRYARRTGQRIGDPEVLMELRSLADVQIGYDLGYDVIAKDWARNRERWHHA